MKTVTFILRLVEPVLVTAPGGDPNSDQSQPFVPGSVVRGALAGRYDSEGADFNRLFLDGGIRFLNAYPIGVNWQRSLPTPLAWVKAKNPKEDGTDHLYDRTQDQTQVEKVGQTKGLKNSFFEFRDGRVATLRLKYEVAVHTQRNRPKGRAVKNDPESAVFRYQALAAGHRFAGAILVDTNNKEDAETLLKLLQGGPLLLGGSQSAGYGLVEVEQAAIAGDWRETGGTVGNISAGTPFTVFLLSDAILRDPNTGQEGAALPAALERHLSGRKLKPMTGRTFTRLGWGGGFNVKWGLPLPQQWATLKGSSWTLVCEEGEITAGEIEKIERAGLGERRAEGFGRLVFAPGWPAATRFGEDKEALLDGPAAGQAFPRLDGAAAKLAGRMRERLARQELDKRVVLAAQQKAKGVGRVGVSKSQLARLRLRVQRESGKQDMSDFRAYLAGTHQRKSADDQFSRFNLGGRNFRGWLEDLAAEPQSVWAEMDLKKWQPPVIGAEPYNYQTAALSHEYTIRLISAVCEQLAKQKEDR